MIGNVIWFVLCLAMFLAIDFSGETHWVWKVIQYIFLTISWLSMDKALDKEKNILKRIEELENIHKEKE